MPTTYAIPNGATVMAATTYTGNGTSQSISNGANNPTGVTFKPDLIWTKGRNGVTNHSLVDSVRGSSLQLSSNQTIAEVTDATEITAFNTNGFSVGNSTGAGISTNANGTTYVGWQWQAGQGTTSSNTNGSITSTTSVNATAGFSVATYTGTGVTGTVGHGLGVAPKMIIVKSRSLAGGQWDVYHGSTGNTGRLFLDASSAFQTVDVWNNTSPTSTVFTINGSRSDVNSSGYTYVAYCWAEVAGFSKFGSYTGNASADGPFVYLGFRPRWIMIKSTGIEDWRTFDTSRSSYNIQGATLYPNTTSAESSAQLLDINSNGFKVRTTDGAVNGSGTTYIYAAFAENPFKYANAR